MALPNPDGVPVQIDGLTAIVVPFTSLENIAPLLPSCDDDLDKLFPWVFTQQDVATEDGVYRWPEEGEEYRFCKLFEALIDIPRQPRGFCDMGRMNERFSSQPDGYWEQQKCLHLLVSEVGGFVRKSLSLDRNRFKLQYCQELITAKSEASLIFERYDELRTPMKYFVNRLTHKKSPRPLGRTSLRSTSLQSKLLYIPVISYTSTSRHDTPQDYLQGNLKIILGQLTANIKALGQPGNEFRDQEVFIVGMHGQFLHIMRGLFDAKDMAAIWLGKDLGHYAFKVYLSNDYNLLVKEEFLAVIRGLVGVFHYFFSGKAKVGAFQIAL